MPPSWKGMTKMKYFKSAKEPEIYYYFNAKKEKLWMYRHKYYNSDGKRTEKKKSSFKTEKAALKALLKVKAATLRGETKHIEYDNLNVATWLDMWYEANQYKWKDTTRVQREYIIRLHLKPFLGHYKLQKLDRYTYQKEFINRLRGKYKSSSIQRFHTIFKIAINAAVEEEILQRNRFTKITITNPNETTEPTINNFLTPAQLVAFLKEAELYNNLTIYMFILLVAYTGLRRGEALGLRWSDVDFTNNSIKIERTRDDQGVRSPKTKNSYRTILVDEIVITQLTAYKKWCKELQFKCGKKVDNDTYIFLNEKTGREISHTNVLWHFNKIKLKQGFTEITVHGLRHTHATILLNEEQNVKEIAERLGNTVDMIYQIYGHVLKELKHKSVTLFSQSLSKWG